MNLKKEFCSYEQSLALKELEFDEECLAYYHTTLSSSNVDLVLGKTHNRFYHLVGIPEHFNTLAPLYQQAFRFFMEKYNLCGLPQYFTGGFYCFTVNYMKDNETSNRLFTEFNTYEKAEEACLDKLIEIAKQQNNGHTINLIRQTQKRVRRKVKRS